MTTTWSFEKQIPTKSYGLKVLVFRKKYLHMYRPVASRGAGGNVPPPQFLTDQLTLSQPGAHYPHPVLRAPPPPPPIFRPCDGPAVYMPPFSTRKTTQQATNNRVNLDTFGKKVQTFKRLIFLSAN